MIIEMPETILIEHAVRIVHPTIKRCVMILWTVLLTIDSIESVGQREILPAAVIHGIPYRRAVLIGHDIQHDIMTIIRRQVKRHHIIDLLSCQTHIESLFKFIVDHKIYSSVVCGLLYGHQQISAIPLDPHQRIVDTENVNLHTSGCRRENSHLLGMCRRSGQRAHPRHYEESQRESGK